MRKSVVAMLLAILAAGSVYALDPGQSELEYNGWFRYTNQSSKFNITNPTASRSTLERDYLRAGHQWTSDLYSKLTLDFLSSSSYADGASVRIKEAYVDMATPLKDFNFTAGMQKVYFGEIYSWDYTHPDKELSDAQGVCSSADYGATINGFLPSGLGELQLGAYNGEGYKVTGAKNSTAPMLLGNLRLTPIAGFQIGASVFNKVKDFSPYANSAGKLSTDRHMWLNPDTANRNRLAFAPMAKVAFGPASLTGEYIMYKYTRNLSFYKADSASGKVDSTSLTQSTKDYNMSGIDLLPVVTLMNHKLDVFGRFSTWLDKEQSGDSMPENKAKTMMQYGLGFNYHFLRRAGGSKPAVAFQFAWIRQQTDALKPGSTTDKVDPTDTFMAQFRLEWNHVLSAQ